MRTLSEALRAEHTEFRPGLERIRRAAEAVDCAAVPSVKLFVLETCDFLTRHLGPHARAEEAVLYPAVASLLGAPAATEPMVRMRGEIARYTAELGDLRGRLAHEGLSPAVASDLRRVLYSLYAILLLHFAIEEELYQPLLETRLTESDARALMRRMSEVARRNSVELEAAALA